MNSLLFFQFWRDILVAQHQGGARCDYEACLICRKHTLSLIITTRMSPKPTAPLLPSKDEVEEFLEVSMKFKLGYVFLASLCLPQMLELEKYIPLFQQEVRTSNPVVIIDHWPHSGHWLRYATDNERSRSKIHRHHRLWTSQEDIHCHSKVCRNMCWWSTYSPFCM